MDWKVKEQNVKTYNPLQYQQDQMSYDYTRMQGIQDDTQENLDQQANTLRDELFGESVLQDMNEEVMVQNPLTFEERVAKTKELSRKQASSLSKTWKIFGNSVEMDRVIKMVNGVNALLEGDIPRDLNGRIDADVLKKKHLKGYDAALSACQYYLDTKTPKYGWTKKRYDRVKNMKQALEKERELLEVVVSNIADVKYDEEELKNVKTPRDLLSKVRSVGVEGEAELQTEGNSTDVYRVKLVINGKEGWYYFKQNLKPVGDDLPGFVKRRLRQLKNSKSYIGNANKEEARLCGNIDLKDYELGEEFLKGMQTSINQAAGSVKDTRTLNSRFLTFLGHDFDNVFEALKKNNIKADESERELLELRAALTKAKKENQAIAAQAIENQIKNHKIIKRMTEYEWIEMLAKQKTNPLGLDVKKDRALFNILKRMSEETDPKAEVQGENNRISRFFTRTLGKEIEAYGQQKERSEASDNEVMAKNNTASYRVANMFGFNDVVTSSESAVINIKLAGNENAEDVSGTISVEAPGCEMLQLVEIAEKSGKKIHYSPNAVRQLTRLYMFDTNTLQTDRHWRNFKCMTKPDLRQHDMTKPITEDITVESIGSYDHDMSFGLVDLKTAFINKNNPTGENVKNGMLPPLIRRIKASSAENSYFQNRLLGGVDLGIFDKMKMPEPAVGSGYKAYHDNQKRIGFYGCRFVKIKDLPFKLEDVPQIQVNNESVRDTIYEYKGKYFRKDGDRDKVYICDINGQKAGCSILENNMYSEVNVGLNLFKEGGARERLVETIDSSKTVIGGKDVSVGLENRVFKCGEEIQKRLSYKRPELGTDVTDIKRLSELKREDQVAVIANSILLHSAISQIDFSDNEYEKEEEKNKISYGTGYRELRIKAVIYYVKQELDCLAPDLRQSLIAEAQKVVMGKLKEEEDSKKKDKKVEEKKQQEKAEYIEVPAMLHLDAEAYRQICRMKETFDPDILYALQDLGWEQDKIDAYRQRIDDQIAEIQKCQIMAEKILEKKYPDPNDPRRHFLLEKNDYNSIDDIAEIAWDPGMSYFATEDENFLMSDEVYRSYLSDDQQKSKLDATNKHRNIKRLHGLKQNLTVYETMISGHIRK